MHISSVTAFLYLIFLLSVSLESSLKGFSGKASFFFPRQTFSLSPLGSSLSNPGPQCVINVQALGFLAWNTAAASPRGLLPPARALDDRLRSVTSLFGWIWPGHFLFQDFQWLLTVSGKELKSSSSKRGTSLLCFCPLLQNSFAKDYFEIPMRVTSNDF